MRAKRKKRTSTNRRKRIYILPNLITSASLFCGFFSIIAAIQGRYEAAAIAIFISAVFDGLDGRIARYTKTASHFGTEYDSLSDLVAFGAAPAILAFLWALEPFGRLGWLAAFMFVICGALRLARFNVEKASTSSDYFKGLPIPAAACFIAATILFTGALEVGIVEKKDIIIIVMIYVLSFLMVSSVNFPSFKEFNIRNQKPFNVLVAFVLISIVIAYKPKILLFLILLAYIVSGPVITIYHLNSRRSREKSGDPVPEESKDKEVDASINDQSVIR